MHTKNKIFIDRLVGLPLAWFLNLAARLLGKVLRRDHGVGRDNVKTIVISKYVGMGSILQATPLIRSIRVAYPDARLIFLTSRANRRLVERLEHLDAIMTIDDGTLFALARTSLRTVVQLAWGRVDLFFDLELYSAYASIISLLSLARNRVGFYRESAQHKRGNYTHLMYFNTRNPIRYIYVQLGRLVGCEPVDPDRLGRIRVDAADREEVSAKFEAAGLGPGDYVVVNPNASDLLVERRWPAERFAGLVGRLADGFDRPIILIGSPAERPYVESLASRVESRRGRVVNLAGELSLGGLFALLEGAHCVITNDTGPLHMAWSLGTPTVGLFGPGDPRHYGQNTDHFRIIYKSVYCSPCLYEVSEPPCLGNNVCMQRISVDEVFDAVGQVLAASKGREQPLVEDPRFFSDQGGRPLGRMVRGGV